jgi:hypothetical protein
VYFRDGESYVRILKDRVRGCLRLELNDPTDSLFLVHDGETLEQVKERIAQKRMLNT